VHVSGDVTEKPMLVRGECGRERRGQWSRRRCSVTDHATNCTRLLRSGASGSDVCTAGAASTRNPAVECTDIYRRRPTGKRTQPACWSSQCADKRRAFCATHKGSRRAEQLVPPSLWTLIFRSAYGSPDCYGLPGRARRLSHTAWRRTFGHHRISISYTFSDTHRIYNE
jgi:hypothetical protein